MLQGMTSKTTHQPFLVSSKRVSVADEIARICADLRRLAECTQAGRLARDTSELPANGNTEEITTEHLRAISRARARRKEFFTASLFADPAWDMLLDLYQAELAQVRISVSSLCAAAGVPSTTALRWLKTLELEGLIERRDDPLDGRRTFVSLTGDASARMQRYFQAVRPRSCL